MAVVREEGSVGIVELKKFTFAQPPNELRLECGRTLGPITLAYETYGEMNVHKRQLHSGVSRPFRGLRMRRVSTRPMIPNQAGGII